MIYAAASMWLVVTTLLAWAAQALWLRILKPKTLNVILWPGALASRLGRIMALLITGTEGSSNPDAAKVEFRQLEEPMPQPKMTLLGPLLIALVPMTLLALLIHATTIHLGQAVIAGLPVDAVAGELPSTLSAFWSQLRSLITLAEATLNAILKVGGAPWKTALFVYLLVCLSVRLAPLPGNVRGHLIAACLVGSLAFLAGTLTPVVQSVIVAAWPLMALTLGILVLILISGLVVSGLVCSFKAITQGE